MKKSKVWQDGILKVTHLGNKVSTNSSMTAVRSSVSGFSNCSPYKVVSFREGWSLDISVFRSCHYHFFFSFLLNLLGWHWLILLIWIDECLACPHLPICLYLYVYILIWGYILILEKGEKREKHQCERETTVTCLPCVPWQGTEPTTSLLYGDSAPTNWVTQGPIYIFFSHLN